MNFSSSKDQVERDVSTKEWTWGLLGCVAFSIVAVLLRGIRWDETYEHAQILAGLVLYPEGHPLLRYTQTAFSVQTSISVMFLTLGASAKLVCGFRNVLFLLSTILPVYALTLSLTRQTKWACTVTLLLLTGILLEFDGSYPTAIWPQLFSNGPIGGGYALLALWAIVTGRHRTSALMVGLMPAIHIGQSPVLLVLFGLYALHQLWNDRAFALKTLAIPFAIGVFVSVGFIAMNNGSSSSEISSGSYAAEGDSTLLWKQFTAHHDPHRQFPQGNGHIILVGVLLLGAALTATTKSSRERLVVFWLTTYAAGIAMIVWGTMTVHAVMGEDIPFLLIGWMPYRLVNHVPSIALVLMVFALTQSQVTLHRYLVPATLLLAALLPYGGTVIPGTLYTRYLMHGEVFAFGLYGAALFVALGHSKPALRVALLACAALGLSLYHQLGGVAFAGGALVAFIGARSSLTLPAYKWAIPCTATFAAFAVLLFQWQHYESLPKTNFDRDLTRYLADHDEADALLAARPDSFFLQARTGHPVLVDVTQPSLISYMPSLAPTVEKVHTKLYGISFMPDAPTDALPWKAIWKSRSVEEWAALGEEFGFTYVIAPEDVPLALTAVVQGDADALYRVPSVRARIAEAHAGS